MSRRSGAETLMGDVRKVARGWRWLRPPPTPRSAPVPPLRTEGSFETDWARRGLANTARGVFQEMLMLPAYRYFASPTVHGRERLLPVKQPVVIAANHVSHIDTGAIVDALPRHFRGKLAVG